jgi:hypothetical protein
MLLGTSPFLSTLASQAVITVPELKVIIAGMRNSCTPSVPLMKMSLGSRDWAIKTDAGMPDITIVKSPT